MLNPDFRDMMSALNDAGVEYLVVGAYAPAAHGIPRATGDLDFWIRPSRENAERVIQALLGTTLLCARRALLIDPVEALRSE